MVQLKKALLFILLISGLLVITACAGDGADETENTEEQKDLTVGLASEPVSLDPHAANDDNSLYVMNAIYDTLVEQNTNLEIQPALAESLEQIEGTVWEAKLRKDVNFHDESAFNAEVVKANLDRVLDPDMGSPLAFLFDMIDSVDVIDEYTVHIHTKYPFSALPSHLAHPGGHMISLEAIEKDNEAIANGAEPFAAVNENPIGTGYFKYDERTSGEQIKVVKNEDYWGEQAGVDSVTFKFVPEDLTRIAELQTGDSDIIYPVNTSNIDEVDTNEGTHVKQSDSASMSYLGFNIEKEPFSDPRVRQAIAKAINKEEITEGVLNGVALPAKGPLAPTVFGYDEEVDPIDYNVAEAKELLKEAGYEDGFNATMMTYDTNTSDIAQVIQAELKKIGVDIDIEMTEVGTYLEVTGNGGVDMFIGSWGTVTLDADYGLYPMFHSANAGNPGNRSFYANDEVDALLEEARQEGEEGARLQLYSEAQQIIVDEAPIVPLYHSVLLAGLRDEVNGFYQFPSSFPFLRDVSVE